MSSATRSTQAVSAPGRNRVRTSARVESTKSGRRWSRGLDLFRGARSPELPSQTSTQMRLFTRPGSNRAASAITSPPIEWPIRDHLFEVEPLDDGRDVTSNDFIVHAFRSSRTRRARRGPGRRP